MFTCLAFANFAANLMPQWHTSQLAAVPAAMPAATITPLN